MSAITSVAVGLGLGLVVFVTGCAAPPAAKCPPPATCAPGLARVADAAAARAAAEKAAVAAGHALDVFTVRTVERVPAGDSSFAGRWRVFFEHVPPTPPGGHFTVYVDPADGKTQIFPGE